MARKTALFFTILCFVSRIDAAEVDTVTATQNFFSRFFQRSASADVNKFINAKIDRMIDDLNRSQIPCPSNFNEAEPVYEVVKKGISDQAFYVGHFIAEEVQAAIPATKRYIVPLHESIYNQYHWWTFDGISLSLKGTLDIIKVNGTLWGYDFIGLDKIGHFFKEGYEYFDKAYLQDNGDVRQAIRWGQETEKSYFGETTTGVYSYADLVANFNGMRFWNQLLMFSPDIIATGAYHNSPYFTCRTAWLSGEQVVASSRHKVLYSQHKQVVSWQKNKNFDIDRYADGAWDETNNCNQYRNVDVAKKVYAGMFKVLREDQLRQQTLASEKMDELARLSAQVCPRVKSKCKDSTRKYGVFASELLHKSCRIH